MLAVSVGIFRWRIPRLMGIEAVDPQEERSHRMVVSEPLAGGVEHPGALVVVLVLPVALVEQVIHHAHVRRHIHGRTYVPGELRFDQPGVAAFPIVRFLSPHDIQVSEPPREVHGRLEHVIRVGYKCRQIPSLQQHFRDRVLLRGDLVPAGGMVPVSAPVEVVPPREAAHPGE